MVEDVEPADMEGWLHINYINIYNIILFIMYKTRYLCVYVTYDYVKYQGGT